MGWVGRGIAVLVLVVGAAGTGWLATKPTSELLVMVATGVVFIAVLLNEPIKKRLTDGWERSRDVRDKLRMLTGRGDVQQVRDGVDAVALGVHKAADASDGTIHKGLPRYVRRDAEVELDEAFKAGGLIVIQGPSAAGKSRLAFETMRRLAPRRRLVVPHGKGWYRPERPHRDAVVWLDDVEHHILDGILDAASIDAHSPPGVTDVVLLATLRAEARTALRGPDGTLTEAAAKVLNRATVIVLKSSLSDAERTRAEQFRDDPRIADALDQPSGTGFAEYIAAGPAAVAGWKAACDGEDVTAGAIISAAVDAHRAGYLSPLPRVLLEELHLLYLGRHLHDPHRTDFSDSLLWTLRPVRGATGYLTREDSDCYAPFDYLVDHTQSTSSLTSIPTAAWPVLLARASIRDLISLGGHAFFAGEKDTSEQAWRRAADSGNSAAMFELGDLLEGTSRRTEAEHWYRRAADAGHHAAMFRLGNFLADTDGVGEAEHWYRRAAEAGDTAAMYNLGILLKDTFRLGDAEPWLRRAAEAGDTAAMYNLGIVLAGADRTEEARRWYRRAAETDHTIAMRNLVGILSGTDLADEVEHWYRRAAENHPAALHNLGILLEVTDGMAEAEHRWRQAAEADDTAAMYNLGVLLAGANGMEEAEHWYRRAADGGNVAAMYNLANLLSDTDRMPEAEHWWRQAAQGGDAPAMNNLGILLKDTDRLGEAEHWWRQAAEDGHPEAMKNLGVLLRNTGRIEEAVVWLRRFVKAGSERGVGWWATRGQRHQMR